MPKANTLFKRPAVTFAGNAHGAPAGIDASRAKRLPLLFKAIALLALTLLTATGCSLREEIDLIINPQDMSKPSSQEELQDYYDNLYKETTKRVRAEYTGISDIKALDVLPKDPQGRVNWTAAVVQGLINPKPSLDPNVEDEPPLKLNIFIEAKVPLMANVIFPHSIHTYWLSCKNCHPKIFLPEAGANPISMDAIFKGEWCGRCHGKVAFNFWPRENCLRCHMVLKGQSGQKENWR